jgi:GNAT superfamily N-acetyltransferase
VESPAAPEGNEGNDVRVGFRPAEPGDMHFVADSWRRSYIDYQHLRAPGGLAECVDTQQRVIMECLKTSSVLVAYPAEPEPSQQQILGWCCYRRGPLVDPPAGLVLHYLYVKAPFRRHGIGRALFDAIEAERGQLYSTHLLPRQHRTGWLGQLRILHNPALIFGAQGETDG